METRSLLKYKIQTPDETANNIWRVHWQAVFPYAGYEDFNSLEEAHKFIKKLNKKWVI